MPPATSDTAPVNGQAAESVAVMPSSSMPEAEAVSKSGGIQTATIPPSGASPVSTAEAGGKMASLVAPSAGAGSTADAENSGNAAGAGAGISPPAAPVSGADMAENNGDLTENERRLVGPQVKNHI